MKLFFTSILLILNVQINFSQENDTIEPKTIEGQFDKIFKVSTTFQNYKIVGKDEFLSLKKNVLDSVKKFRKAFLNIENLLKNERENIAYLNETLTQKTLELDNALFKENSMSLFGAPLNKFTYSFILWTIIIGFGAGIVFFVFKFLKSNVIAKQAQDSLLIVEEEFEIHRKNSIEREQKLRRQLQDEINKHRNP
ncbi:hypothetical protein [Polaribacter sp.]|uniref:hypothetical protein n=1 Tax=Polaribacter sp. TaxID=1920175 RepID=UPI0040486457